MSKVHLVSLGCPKNLVDSEVMLGLLQQAGSTVTENPAEADLLLVNTCGFIQSAVEESIDEILQLAAYKKEDPAKLLVVTGCLVQRYGKDLAREIPEVDLLIGTDGFQEITTLLSRCAALETGIMELRKPRYLMDATTPRQLSTPSFRAYLKITEGCDNRCSYCMIPKLRGRLRSRSLGDLVREARRLEAEGVRELSLIAQDLTAYGADRKDGVTIIALLEQLLQHTTIPWLRLLYLYPSSLSRDLLALIAREPRVLPYFDIPLQHVSDMVLRRMNRNYGRREIEDLLSAIRSTTPDAAIRTTLIVGFPGETQEDMAELLQFLEIHQLDHVGVFPYADEEGTAAHQFSGKIGEKEKQKRYRQVMELQAAIAETRQRRYIGRIEQVLVEGVSRESELLLEGRTRFQAPEIDGCLYITEGTANPGELVMVRITQAHTYDLAGTIIPPDH